MLGEVWLNLHEVAELEGKSWEAINKSIRRGKLKAKKIETNAKCGFEYRVNITELSDGAKAKYFARVKDVDVNLDDLSNQVCMSLDELTAEQRDQAFYWEQIIKQWRTFISGFPKQMTEKTDEFVDNFNSHNDIQISARTLHSKNKLYKQHGVAALADGRKNREKRGRNIDERLWSIFLQWWLDENEPTTSHVYYTLTKYADQYMPDVEIPSESTFRRALNEIPKPVIKYFRNGLKEFEDECLPYISRTYDLIESNEFWSSDYHTLDLMVKDDITGEVFRPHLVVWIDVRSRKFLSMRLRKNSDSDGVVLSFRDAVMKYGIPKNVYLDNGREFLVHDFGGRGKRKTDVNADYGTSMLDRLGVNMINAIVKNSKAKVIERAFKQITSEFAKLFITYCGNRPGNRPERHNNVLKNDDNIPFMSEVNDELCAFIEGWYNMKSSNAEGLKGMCPNECYAKNLIRKKVATDDQLNIMLLRSTRKQQVDRNGVFVRIGDTQLWFYDAEFVAMYQGKKVYVRFDPDNLASVRVYDEYEKFMAVLDRAAEGGYEGVDNTEAMKKVNSDKKKIKKTVKDFLDYQTDIMEAPKLRDVVINVARDNMNKDNISYDATILEAKFEKEDGYSRACGGYEDIIDFDKMLRNARKNKGE